MTLQTKVFGEVTIEEEKIITFPGGIIGFPDLTQFTLLHDGKNDGKFERAYHNQWCQQKSMPGNRRRRCI